MRLLLIFAATAFIALLVSLLSGCVDSMPSTSVRPNPTINKPPIGMGWDGRLKMRIGDGNFGIDLGGNNPSVSPMF